MLAPSRFLGLERFPDVEGPASTSASSARHLRAEDASHMRSVRARVDEAARWGTAVMCSPTPPSPPAPAAQVHSNSDGLTSGQGKQKRRVRMSPHHLCACPGASGASAAARSLWPRLQRGCSEPSEPGGWPCRAHCQPLQAGSTPRNALKPGLCTSRGQDLRARPSSAQSWHADVVGRCASSVMQDVPTPGLLHDACKPATVWGHGCCTERQA